MKDILIGKGFDEIRFGIRITSYNVCYTKLLRTGYSGEVKNVLDQWLKGNKGNYSVCPPHSGDGHECHNH